MELIQNYTGVTILWFVLLSISFLSWMKFQKDDHHPDAAELRNRSRSWFIILLLMGVAFTSAKIVFLTFVAMLSFFSLREFLGLGLDSLLTRRSLIAIFLVIPLQLAVCFLDYDELVRVFVPIYALSVVPIGLVNQGKIQNFTSLVGQSFTALMISVFCVFHLAFIVLEAREYTLGIASLATLIFIVQLNDVFQYISGKTFGKRQISPNVSKNKTVEGFVGGVLCTSVIGGILFSSLLDYPLILGWFVSLCLGVLGFYGDLYLSAIKRDHGIKDFSRLIPGHGGALDRVDSLTLAVPFFYYLMKAVS